MLIYKVSLEFLQIRSVYGSEMYITQVKEALFFGWMKY